MRKVVVERAGAPEVMALREFPDLAPGPGEVLVRNHACSVMGPDVLMRSGRYRFMRAFPLTPGCESSCVVEAVGAGVTEVRVGEAAYLSWIALPYENPGFYADRMVVPAESLFKLPAGMDLDLAAHLGAYVSAWAMIVDATGGRTIRTALVVGSTGVFGAAQTQVCRHLGMQVIALVSSEAKAEFARQNGATHTINYRTETIVERVKALTDGKGVDLIIDHLGGPNFTDYFDMLAKWGTLISINGVEGSPAKDVFEEGVNRAGKCITLCFFAMYAYLSDPRRYDRLFEAVIPLLVSGALKPRVAKTFPLDEAVEAHRLLESGQALGRIFLKP